MRPNIEQERQELRARATGQRNGKGHRARQLLARMPELAERYRRLMAGAITVLAREDELSGSGGKMWSAPNLPRSLRVK